MSSKYIKCVDCSSEFEFTDGEQEFYADKGYNQPKRCAECRAKKKAQANGGEKHLNNGKW